MNWKRRFLLSLKLEDITDPDYMHAKRVCKGCETKKITMINTMICILKVIRYG